MDQGVSVDGNQISIVINAIVRDAPARSDLKMSTSIDKIKIIL